MTNNIIKNKNKPNPPKDLLLLFAVPIGIVIFAAAIIYTPRLFANPKYDFVYSICNEYSCQDRYSVDASGSIIKEKSNSTRYDYDGYKGVADIYFYDTKNDANKRVTFDEARSYRLNPSSKSDDGYSLVREQSQGGSFLWDSSHSGWYLKNGAKKKGIELMNSNSYDSSNIKFIGWVNK